MSICCICQHLMFSARVNVISGHVAMRKATCRATLGIATLPRLIAAASLTMRTFHHVAQRPPHNLSTHFLLQRSFRAVCTINPCYQNVTKPSTSTNGNKQQNTGGTGMHSESFVSKEKTFQNNFRNTAGLYAPDNFVALRTCGERY